jgi:ribosome-binding protein aMBF1 (putative translation factor)
LSKESVASAYERFPELLVFHKRFRYAARLRGYKDIGALAQALSINRSTVLRWQDGTMLPNVQGLMSISKLLGASMDWLCGNVPKTVLKRTQSEEGADGADTCNEGNGQ